MIFPYFRIARSHGVSYRAVLMLADMLDQSGDPGLTNLLAGRPPMWIVSAVAAWQRERRRRQLVVCNRWTPDVIDMARTATRMRINQ